MHSRLSSEFTAVFIGANTTKNEAYEHVGVQGDVTLFTRWCQVIDYPEVFDYPEVIIHV